MADDTLDQVYANVMDLVYSGGAKGTGLVDDSAAIQAAIENPGHLHVLFPAGTYLLGRGAALTVTDPDGSLPDTHPSIDFNQQDQRCTFLAGAVLKFESSLDYVRVSKMQQTITGMRIEVLASDTLTSVHDPVLDIEGGSRLLMEDLRASSDLPVTTMVQVSGLTKCKFVGGALTGSGTGGTGLRVSWAGSSLGSGCQVGAFGLTLEQFDTAVEIACNTDNTVFVDCSFEDDATSAVLISPGVNLYNLNLIGCHMGGASRRFVHVSEGAVLRGGVISGCKFDELRGFEPRVFLIEGYLIGVVVSGCSAGETRAIEEEPKVPAGLRGAIKGRAAASAAGSTSSDAVEPLPGVRRGLGPDGSRAARGASAGEALGVAGIDYIWDIRATASVSKSCDFFNDWGTTPLATGPNADQLTFMNAGAAGKLAITSKAVQFVTPKMGFFGVKERSRGAAYKTTHSTQRTLTHATTDAVLSTLLQELGNLGLIDCTVISTVSPKVFSP